jgi:hypothetical protein
MHDPASVNALGVDGDDDALAAEAPGAVVDELRVADGGAVDADLVGAGQQGSADVFQGADAATHAEGDKHAVGDAAHHIERRLAVFVAGGDVEEDEFIGSFAVVDGWPARPGRRRRAG